MDGPGKSKWDLFLNMMNEYSLSQHSEEISHHVSNNILDLILSSNPGYVLHVYCTPGMSDHNTVICVCITCLSIDEGLKELSLCIAKQIGMIFVQKVSI